jgi:hypothetical protein
MNFFKNIGNFFSNKKKESDNNEEKKIGDESNTKDLNINENTRLLENNESYKLLNNQKDESIENELQKAKENNTMDYRDNQIFFDEKLKKKDSLLEKKFEEIKNINFENLTEGVIIKNNKEKYEKEIFKINNNSDDSKILDNVQENLLDVSNIKGNLKSDKSKTNPLNKSNTDTLNKSNTDTLNKSKTDILDNSKESSKISKVFKVYVKTFSGNVLNFDVVENTKIGDIKKGIFKSEGILENQQRLIYNNQELRSDYLLKNYNIKDSVTFSLTSILNGGIKNLF